MTWLAGSLAYLVIHALLYASLLRTIPAFTSERGIFLYHFVSAVLYSMAALAALAWLPTLTSPAFMVAAIMLHGIYSLSFLEVWSLTEGSYSLQILRAIGVSERGGQTISLAALEAIGRGKQGSRTATLERLGLVVRDGTTLQLTPRGRSVAAALYTGRSLVSSGPGQ